MGVGGFLGVGSVAQNKNGKADNLFSEMRLVFNPREE
jgi:hypothetical protein